MDPTLHYKMKADEACDGSGEGCNPDIDEQKPDVNTGPREKNEH